MPNETSLTPVPIVSTPDVPMQLAARDPVQMQASRKYLLLWFESKLADESANHAEIQAAIDSAIKHKWQVNPLRNQLRRAAARIAFYTKSKAAIEAGYTLVPNFPIDLFAIRVDRSKPVPQHTDSLSLYGWPSIFDEQPQHLDQGEGRYVNPSQLVRQWSTTEADTKGGERERRHTKATNYQSVEFPVMVAHPVVMDATSEAMALKLFDSIGICQDASQSRRISGRRRGDPLVIGRIYGPKTSGYREPRHLSFLIAWHVDLRNL